MNRKCFALALFATFTLAAVPASAQKLYKWVDASGRTQYSDTAPVNHKAEPVSNHMGSVSGAAASAAPLTTADKEQAFRKRQIEAEEAQKKQAQADETKKAGEENCRRAQSQLSMFQQGGRISQTNEKGQREFLDDSKIKQESERARKAVEQWCKA
jgi:hypothetical protein